jgi:hypothetical protein
MRSKGFYRFLGTLLGAAATLVIIPNLVDAPELASAAVALWVGFCLYFALLDRSPRSYVFMLAAYSAGIIGLPSVKRGHRLRGAGARPQSADAISRRPSCRASMSATPPRRG